jgi:glycosyltransferase involved in cell wall biosynthesis
LRFDPCERELSTAPQFSVIIPVYNDWTLLERCLQSLNEQLNPPAFEVIVVDDGSSDCAPECVPDGKRSFSCRVVRQEHTGIASARNHGIRAATGSVLLFVDSDCRLDARCLAALNASIVSSPAHDCFQLHLTGDKSNLLGRAEELRLAAFQRLMLQPDCRIRYLNTAGFAIRRSRANGVELFDPGAVRGEDTLLLAQLIQTSELPLFVADAVVEHTISLSLIDCLRKDIRSVRQESKAYEMIAAKGVQIRVSHPERLRLLRAMWAAAGQESIGRTAWFVAVTRQAVQRVFSFSYQYWRLGSSRLDPQL